ncbi:hypothetical protein CK203_116019 [Vitis vinifera]|uniref:Uncharacterized protein n=1 Tax=Vitis vinifera TaxID=29760 RepID=A0A438FF60_VITVI|nr:hypothetical protein CK203_116019 [Vitis vinifera]
MKQKNKAPAVDDPVDPDENEDFDVICARMEATQRQITDAQSHLNSLIASYNRDVKVLRTRFTSSHYRTDEGQPGVRKTQRRRWCVLFKRGSPSPWATQYVGVSAIVHEHNVDVAPQASEEIRPRRVKMKVEEEETHVADYVFDESKDPSEMLCAYGGYGVTREQLQCLVGESFIDIPVISMFCRYMNAKEENPSRRHFFNPYFGEICGSMSKSTSKSTLKKRLGSYCVNLECCNQMSYWDVCYSLYATLGWNGLNRTINSERMSLERLKFATHMVLDSENKIGEMEVTNKLIEEDAFDADQKDAFKNFVKDNVREAKKANRQAREARKKALQK